MLGKSPFFIKTKKNQSTVCVNIEVEKVMTIQVVFSE
jgi:hypothetical protein